MEYIVVSDTSKKHEEILIDVEYDSFKYDYEKNVNRSITFDVIKTPFNDFAFDILTNESTITYDGQQYIVKTCDITMLSNGILKKSITAPHIMYEFQNHVNYDLIVGTKDYTISDYLKIAFENNKLGYTYEIKGVFNSATLTDVGDMNGIEFLTNAVESFGCIIFADNKKIIVYDEKSFYKESQEVLRYRYNTDDVQVSTNTTAVKTVVKAYGKKKDKQESTYSQKKTTDLKLQGAFIKTGTYYTETVNDSYTTDVDVKWVGDSLDFKFKKDKFGGVWDVYLDNTKIKTLTAYNKSAKTETVNLSNNLSKGKHTIKFVFAGDDPEHPMPIVEKTKIVNGKRVKYKEKQFSRGYIGTETATIFVVNANTEGNNAYHAIVTYKSPNIAIFGERMANSIKSDSITDTKQLELWAKSQLQDTQETSLDLKYSGNASISENDTLFFVHETLGFSTDLKIVKISKSHEFANKALELSFSNSKKDIVSIQRSLSNKLKQTSKQVSNSFVSINTIKQTADDAYTNILITEYVGSVDD